MLIKCPECGHQVSDQAKTCPSCGIDIAGKITRCPDCGEVIFKEQSFCPNCHCSINGASTTGIDLVESSSVRDVLPVARHSAEKALQEEARQQPDTAPRRSRKKKAGMAALIIGFVIALIAVFLLIYFMKNQERQVEQRAYENAIKSTEPLVLQNFLDMYGDAPKVHRDSIQLLLNGLKKIENDWHDAMVNFVDTETVQNFTPDPSTLELRYCTDTGLLATSKCPSTMIGYYRKSNIPPSCDSRHDGLYWSEHGDSTIPLYE